MLKFIKRLFRLFSIKGNKALKKFEDPVEIYEHQLKDIKGNIDKVSDNISDMRAKKRLSSEELTAAGHKIKSLTDMLDKAIDQDDDQLGQEVQGHLEKWEIRQNMQEQTIQAYDTAISTLEDRMVAWKDQYQEKKLKLEQLKAQHEFAQNMQSINQDIKANFSGDEINMGELEELEKEIKQNAYKQEDLASQIEVKPSIIAEAEKGAKQSRYEEYKAQRLAQRSGSEQTQSEE